MSGVAYRGLERWGYSEASGSQVAAHQQYQAVVRSLLPIEADWLVNSYRHGKGQRRKKRVDHGWGHWRMRRNEGRIFGGVWLRVITLIGLRMLSVS